MPDTTIPAPAAALQACDPDATGTAVCHVLLGLTAAVFPAAAGKPAEEITDGVIRVALRPGDAHAAHEVLRHLPRACTWPQAQGRELSAVVIRAGLGRGASLELLTSLQAAAGTAESVLAATLAGAP